MRLSSAICYLTCLIGVSTILLGGCSSYENAYTGSYRSQNTGNSERPALQIDFFRFGDYASAYIRLFETDPATGNRFGRQITCLETNAGSFTSSGQFDLRVESTFQFPALRLIGEVRNSSQLEVQFFSPETGSTVVLNKDRLSSADESKKFNLERHSGSPTRRCQPRPGIELRFSFPRDRQTEGPQRLPESANYSPTDPAIVLWWTGTTTTTTADGNKFTSRTDHISRIASLEEIVDDRGLIEPNSSPIAEIAEPPDDLVMESGETQFAIGHLFVADLRESLADGNARSSFENGPNRILGTGLMRAAHPGCPAATTFWGPFVLFIEGTPNQLGGELSRLLSGERQAQLAEKAPANRHFFVLDVCATKNEIVRIQLPSEVTRQSVSMFLTPEYLHTSTWPVPQIQSQF